MIGGKVMTIRRLYIFKTVCEEGSVTGAAKKLYMTQPAVSHVIHELEEELGTVLFDRISKKVFLNQTGKLLLKRQSASWSCMRIWKKESTIWRNRPYSVSGPASPYQASGCPGL